MRTDVRPKKAEERRAICRNEIDFGLTTGGRLVVIGCDSSLHR